MFFGKVHISAISQNGSSWIKNFFWLLEDLFMIYHLYKFHFVFGKGSWNIAAWKWLPKPYFTMETSIKACYLSTMFYIIQVKYNYSLVLNRRLPRWVIFKNFSSQDILIPIPNSQSPPPPAIISWKKFHPTQAK